MNKDIIKTIQEIIKNELFRDNASLDDGIYDLGADSLDFLEIIMETERRFSISIEDEELADIKTVRDLVKCVERKI